MIVRSLVVLSIFLIVLCDLSLAQRTVRGARIRQYHQSSVHQYEGSEFVIDTTVIRRLKSSKSKKGDDDDDDDDEDTRTSPGTNSTVGDDDDDDDGGCRRSRGKGKGKGGCPKGDDDDDGGDDDGDDDEDDENTEDDVKCDGTVVVANRGNASITILDAVSGDRLRDLPLPFMNSTEERPVPTDVVTVNGIIYVSDTANDRVVAFDAVSYNVIATIPTGDGVTELAVDARGTQLWATNTEDNTITIIDLQFNVPIRTLEAPIATGNNVVNDVVLTPSGDAGFVSFTGAGGGVVRFEDDGTPSQFTDAVGDNTRLSSSFRFNCLYAPSTDDNLLRFLFTGDLVVEGNSTIQDPFDSTVSTDGRFLYISSTTGNFVRTFDIGDNALLDTVVTTAIENPTKMAHTGSRLFVAHGDSDSVSVYSTSAANPVPVLIATQTVGDNPFGISFCEPTAICRQ